jgi:4-amino-4-deoxy-L-arabinose transferase-like glycosyltransferase
LLFLGYSIRPYRPTQGTLAASTGVLGLTLCGAPELAILLGCGGAWLEWRQARAAVAEDALQRDKLGLGLILAGVVASGLVAHGWGLWQSPGYPFALAEVRWEGYAQMLVWFMWPAWPISAWALWSWRRHLRDWSSNRHLAWPLYCVVAISLVSLRLDNADTTLLLALPPLAALAAFSLVTMNRQVSALMDWFAVLFFSVCGIIIWVVWVAMHTGVPAAPAANVARLLPEYIPRVVWWELVLALAVSGAWAALVRWRSGRHRTAIWKTLVLPAGGATLCWLLLATLWMPLLDFAQSYKALAVQVQRSIPQGQCVQTMDLDRHEIAALRWYGQLKLASPWQLESCPWLLVQAVGEDYKTETQVDLTQWRLSAVVSHFVVYRDSVLLYQHR